LRALHYPTTTDAIIEKQQRAGAHTDYGSLTILLPQVGTTGLQIKKKNSWIDVPALEDCLIINIGDLMELWTAGTLGFHTPQGYCKTKPTSKKKPCVFSST
jgi:isopenicillin N synthase-like dioxygenase